MLEFKGNRRWVETGTAGDKIHSLEKSRVGYMGGESIG